MDSDPSTDPTPERNSESDVVDIVGKEEPDQMLTTADFMNSDTVEKEGKIDESSNAVEQQGKANNTGPDAKISSTDTDTSVTTGLLKYRQIHN